MIEANFIIPKGTICRHKRYGTKVRVEFDEGEDIQFMLVSDSPLIKHTRVRSLSRPLFSKFYDIDMSTIEGGSNG